MPQVSADEPPENGKHVEYDENGKKTREAHYKDGMPDGLETFWFSTGRKQQQYWKDRNIQGLRTTWDKNGRVTQKETLRNSRVVHSEKFDKEGNKIEERFYSHSKRERHIKYFKNGRKKLNHIGIRVNEMAAGRCGRRTALNLAKAFGKMEKKLATSIFNE